MLSDTEQEAVNDLSQILAHIRWSRASKAEKQMVGSMLGRASKNRWADMTAEERSAVMRDRAEVREENKRRVAAGLPKLDPRRHKRGK